MKKILIVEEELSELPHNKRIKLKKNKTIIKDRNYFTEEFVNMLKDNNIPYGFYLEEWEVVNSEKIQLVAGNNGNALRPVHIIDDSRPREGVKALFQSEKMIILRLKDNTWELSKNTVNENGEIESSVLGVGTYTEFGELKKSIDKTFFPMVDTLEKNYENYKKIGYLSPFWAQII